MPVLILSRGNTMIVPRGPTQLQPGDHLFVIARDDIRPSLDCALVGIDVPSNQQ